MKDGEGIRHDESFMQPYSEAFDLIISNTNERYLLEKGNNLLTGI